MAGSKGVAISPHAEKVNMLGIFSFHIGIRLTNSRINFYVVNIQVQIVLFNYSLEILPTSRFPISLEPAYTFRKGFFQLAVAQINGNELDEENNPKNCPAIIAAPSILLIIVSPSSFGLQLLYLSVNYLSK
jgi:hypothetical protein